MSVTVSGGRIRAALGNYVILPSGIGQVTFELTSAQILALHTTGVQYLAPIAANAYALPFSCDYIYYFGGVAYTRNNLASVTHFWDNITSAGLSAGGMLTQTVDSVSNIFSSGILSGIATSSIVNKGLFVRVGAGTSFTLGNGTLKIKVLYHIVTV